VGEVPEVKLTGPVRAVLTALADQHGHKLAVRAIAVQTRLSPPTVRTILSDLGKAKLVQHQLLPSAEGLPPRLGYWLTGAGIDVARSAGQ
jgi:DNA-binding MarR family transcriptional regulator